MWNFLFMLYTVGCRGQRYTQEMFSCIQQAYKVEMMLCLLCYFIKGISLYAWSLMRLLLPWSHSSSLSFYWRQKVWKLVWNLSWTESAKSKRLNVCLVLVVEHQWVCVCETNLWLRQQYMIGLYVVELIATRKTARYTCWMYFCLYMSSLKIPKMKYRWQGNQQTAKVITTMTKVLTNS